MYSFKKTKQRIDNILKLKRNTLVSFTGSGEISRNTFVAKNIVNLICWRILLSLEET